MLALHGWGRRGADFGRSLEGLSALAPDLPGFGASPEPNDILGAEGYASRILPLFDEFDEPPVVVGHSFGGRIAVCVAASHPDLIGSLVLTGVPLVRVRPPGKPSIGFRAARALNRAGLFSDERMEQLRRRSGSTDYQNAQGIMRDIFVRVVNESYEEQLSAVKAGVHMLWGSDDREVPVAVAETARSILEEYGCEAALEVLPGVGHHVPIQAPDDLRRVIDRVMAS